MSSAESDKYIQNQRKLKHAGMDVHVTKTPDELVKIGGIPVTPGPRIILCPDFGISKREILRKVEGGKITNRSSLVLEGQQLYVKNLDLDGALVIRAGPSTHVTVDGLKIRNRGWELEEIPEGADVPETVRIRGYTMAKHESKEYYLYEPGKFYIGPDGEVKKLE
jgi:UDP-sugar pyrophosphorylase